MNIEQHGHADFDIEWIRSATWGLNPRIMFRGQKITNISGCGYCKKSAALASALAFLGDGIAETAGAGESGVIAALDRNGWTLTPISSGKHYGAYTVTRRD